jgi:hypothetical protein
MLLLWGTPPATASDPVPSEPSLEASGAPSAGSEAQTLRALVDALIPTVEDLRGLSFQEAVQVETMASAELAAYVQGRMEEMAEESVWAARQFFLEQIGLIPAGMDLRRLATDLLAEGVAGLYAPERRTLYLVQSQSPFLDRMTLVHELCHALDDQHHDIDGLLKGSGMDEDLSFVASALVEGSATLVMNAWAVGELAAGLASLDDILATVEEDQEAQRELLSRIPLYVQRSLLSSYLTGQWFLSRASMLALSMPNPATIEAAFADPPRSSEQMLHPPRYWDSDLRDEPWTVTPPAPDRWLGSGWQIVDASALGMLFIATLADELEGGPDPPRDPTTDFAPSHPAAEGWRGDRFVVYRSGQTHAALWISAWDRPTDAAELAELLVRHGRHPVLRKGHRVAVLMGGVASERGARGMLRRALRRTTFEAYGAP